MMIEPEFLTFENILYIHETQMERYGGLVGIRDNSLLESAIAIPEATFESNYLHSFPFQMAAAYAFHIAQNQPFLDGNKRTGLLSALVFLDLNGYTIANPSTKLEKAMLSIAEGKMTKGELATLFETLCSSTIE